MLVALAVPFHLVAILNRSDCVFSVANLFVGEMLPAMLFEQTSGIINAANARQRFNFDGG